VQFLQETTVTTAARTAAVAAAIVFVLPVVRPPATAQTFRSKVELVRVDVLVTENGRPVSGLSPSDFEILDNGVVQEVEFASFEQLPLNITFALDTSASVAGPALAHLQEASGAVLERLESRDRAALLTFDHTVTLRSPLTPDVEQVRQAIRGVVPRGETALYDAVYSGIVFAEAEIGRNLLIVFTDGADTSSSSTRQEIADAAKTTDLVVYAVAAGVRNRRTTQFLGDVADRTGGRLLQIDATSEVHGAFVGILDEFRHRYLLGFSPRGVTKTGWHRLEVRVKGRRAAVKARSGYQAGF
jgi:Ca-activated chloride channel homolog